LEAWTGANTVSRIAVPHILIELALSRQVEFPDGFTTPWRLSASRPSDVLAEETGRAEHLIRS
jgi:hypothetical protein